MRKDRSKTSKDGRKPRSGSLKLELLRRTLLVMAVLFLMVGALQYVLMKDFIYKNKAESLQAQLMSMPRDWFGHSGYDAGPMEDAAFRKFSVPSDFGPDGADNASDTYRFPPPQAPNLYQPGMSLAFVDNEGNVYDLSPANGTSAPQLSKAQYERIRQKLRSRNDRLSYEIANNSEGVEQLLVFKQAGMPNNPNGISQAGTETSSLKQVLLTQLAIFAGLSVLALAGGLSLYMPILRKALHPLSRIVDAVGRTDAGNLTDRLPEHQGQQEIDQLAVAFNGMLERLDDSFESERRTTERMRRFIADASHELRTPLTSIQGFLEVLLRGAADNPEQLKRALGSMQTESRRINKLVEDLLTLAKLDQAPELKLSSVQLDSLLQEMEPQLHILAGSRAVKLELAEPVSAVCQPDQLKQIVLNLFLNAVQHTDEQSGSIEVALRYTADRESVQLTIADNGPGIPPEHLPHLFERFYRSESSRTRKAGGAGLGLSISKSIVDAHNGSIEAYNNGTSGAVFLVRIPCTR
ncbi:cell wall metabolism sensor histidine kinase WalK [Paenibacillus sp. NEAU-GSW1]|uniref:sensor histidine kinase n=1 Tax=Paenibacillus sp. NEAU-GSW1 TaxID=2682486 RepID=UPI0012E2D623|nr:HAMP domain-containing sensor histidine kinase [Paenibacillus sp. NEAU-GSW1]MUT66914.1 HAMP domain-containing protein [Paenibacillus sp. NEAU-GSW1]